MAFYFLHACCEDIILSFLSGTAVASYTYRILFNVLVSYFPLSECLDWNVNGSFALLFLHARMGEEEHIYPAT